MSTEEFLKELTRIENSITALDEKLVMQRKTTLWLVNKVDELIEKSKDNNSDWRENERMIREANELVGRLQIERESITEDMDNQVQLLLELANLKRSYFGS